MRTLRRRSIPRSAVPLAMAGLLGCRYNRADEPGPFSYTTAEGSAFSMRSFVRLPAMTDATPRFEQAAATRGPAVRLLGEWTAGQFARPDLPRRLQRSLPGAAQAWDLRDAASLDHVGAQLLWDHWGGRWPEQLELLPTQRAILERVARF